MKNNSYDDIINLPHPISKNHPQMSLRDLAAQFAPFAALTGHDAEIKETARLTDERLELSEDVIAQLNEKINISLDAYSRLTDGVEAALDEADQFAAENEKRYTHEEVFANFRRKING